ncbi:hypothetical protein P7K49_027613 [Saguinus oedipus]|uniref:Uncharacterized protein n=1 Tax=Saguinus oedipus TaxID=9490 RepID=A0ABQ9UA44_SAGOE|nr:hypothetical protein P7K49_027613 [Saguinus oedipus]
MGDSIQDVSQQSNVKANPSPSIAPKEDEEIHCTQQQQRSKEPPMTANDWQSFNQYPEPQLELRTVASKSCLVVTLKYF